MNILLSLLPIVLLIYLMVKPKGVASYIALPAIALLVYILQLAWFQQPFMLLNANILSGLISTLTPITIVFGAILFNRMMEVSGNTQILREWLSAINPNPVAQLMIIGWAFAFMIEGASGFGTPAAIAAPILIGLGFNPVKVAIFALVMNSVPVSFGAVGTPTWFGFAHLNIEDSVLLEIGQKTALIHFVAAFIIPLLALRFILSWKDISRNIVFIYLSVLSCTIPYLLLAQVNYEFPSLVGGAIGLLLSILIANMGWGLSKESTEKPLTAGLPWKTVAKALLPTMMLIFILIITRIHQLGLKGLLSDATAWLSVSLGYIGNFEISRSFALSLSNIFYQGVNEGYRTLYVPALIPFVITVVLFCTLFKVGKSNTYGIFQASFSQIKKPFLALLGALIMVKLMLVGGEKSMVITIGNSFASVAGEKWMYFSSYLGAIGAFFSGSNTVSNVTFGAIQQSIANATGLSVPLILALQSVGGAMGNMTCLNNIIAVCSVTNATDQEGHILRKTVAPMFLYGVIAALVALVL